MTTIRDLTAPEAEALRHRHHEQRAADAFVCPHCKADTGVSTYVVEPAVVRCWKCQREFFAWMVPGTIHVSAKL